MFNFLNLRLQQIMGNKEPFGGITVITVNNNNNNNERSLIRI